MGYYTAWAAFERGRGLGGCQGLCRLVVEFSYGGEWLSRAQKKAEGSSYKLEARKSDEQDDNAQKKRKIDSRKISPIRSPGKKKTLM